ncbi:ImmA/IrrE family metallo-endopeptidase [Ruminococcus sp.]|uniref:ImmA/IrrE family metallo-endopeptidase n=1 Tax=Ruminococcus sp. TaxID=41978 RepID=UPI0025D1EC1A|nr:ImmA/IrrE family metallo-endopeptidase [Ruminococcus sp.]MBR1432302.1 ImmA/IrrE family metallo-endopeptidase [Ruminococcus sp.]
MKEKIFPAHPGTELLSEIKRRNMNQKELALRTGVSEKYISMVINGSKDISAALDRKLQIALGSDRGYWLDKQAQYDKTMVEIAEEEGVTDEEIAVLTHLKEITATFISEGYIHNDCPPTEKVLQLRYFLRISNLTDILKYSQAQNVVYRAQVKGNVKVDPYVLFAWQRLCEKKTENMEVDTAFEPQKIVARLPDFRRVMFDSAEKLQYERLNDILSECGIVFLLVESYKGAPIQGFDRKMENGSIILCLTNRGKRADRFWFTLFHELGHLALNHVNERFVDFEAVKSDIEEAADEFARDNILDPEMYRTFINSAGYENKTAIVRFAKKARVPAWVVVGRLQNDDLIPWSACNDLIVNY